MTRPKLKDGSTTQNKKSASGEIKRGRVQKKEKYKTQYGTKKTGEGFAGQRKTEVVHKYHKMLRKDQKQRSEASVKMQRIYEEAGEKMRDSQQRTDGRKVSSFHKEQLKRKTLEKEKDTKRQALKQQQEEKEKALKKYKDNKKLVHKKLSKRNYKGQPNMAAQMEVLLKRIEASKS